MPETLEARLARLEAQNRALRNVVRVAQSVTSQRNPSSVLYRVEALRDAVDRWSLNPEGNT